MCRSGYKRKREAKVCRSLLQKLKDEQADAVRNQQYPATSCPICFEDLAKPEAASDSPSTSSAARVATAYKEDRSDSDFAATSSKSDVPPSAPPLDAHPEYESLLGKRRAQSSSQQHQHKHARCTPAPPLPLFAVAHTNLKPCQQTSQARQGSGAIGDKVQEHVYRP